MSKITRTFAASMIAISLLGGTAALAAEQGGERAPSATPDMHDMMQGGDMNGMMSMMDMMRQMMTNCNNMMEKMMSKGEQSSDG